VITWRPQARAILQVILDGFGDSSADSPTLVIPVLPKSVTVHVNSYKQADSFEMVFDAADLPIDPRIVRAGSAEIFVFNTSSFADKNTVLSRKEPLADPDKGGVRERGDVDTIMLELSTPVSRDRFTLGNKPRIVGLFDDDDLEMSESGKWVTIRGQDYTSFLMGVQWPPMPSGAARAIPTGKRLDQFVEDMVSAADPGGNLGVIVRGINASTLPVVGASEVRSSTRGIPVEQNTTYWDVIYKTVTRHGFIVFVDGYDVVISLPKTITDKDTSQIKRMAWGKNLKHLSMKRHLGREQVPTMIVRSYDPRSKQTISVEYPPNGTIDRAVVIDSTHSSKHGKGKVRVHQDVKESTHTSKKGKVTTTLRERDEYQIVDVYGITDRKVLEQMAETRYHLLGKAERTVTFKTRELADLNNSDLLGVEAGDAFLIDWDDFNRQLLSNPDVTEGAKAQYLVNRGYNSEIATTIARHYSILEGLDRPLRFREGTITYDNEDGVEIEAELLDFVVVDGIRAGNGATRPARVDSNHAKLVKNNGAKVGGNFVPSGPGARKATR
jgi:hypothetical protein